MLEADQQTAAAVNPVQKYQSNTVTILVGTAFFLSPRCHFT